jgi:hypothetical protein
MNDDADNYLPSIKVLRRYDVCSRTLNRWEEKPELGFPKPVRINRRRYWRLAELQAWERARIGSKSKPFGETSHDR